MTSEHDRPNTDTELRRLAEKVDQRNASSSLENIEALSPAEIRQRFHELRVHQIELEMQNEQLRQSQEALEALQDRYFDLYDMAPVAYCTVSEKGLILEVNLKASQLLGRARGVLVRQRLSQFIVTEDQNRYYLLHRQLLASGALQACELRMVQMNGTILWVHLSATLAQDESGASVCRMVLSDQTERKQKEEMIDEERRFLHTILQATGDGFWVVDLEGKIIQVNEAYCRMSGYTRDELLRLDVAAVEAVEEPAEIAAHIQRLIVSGSEIFETRHRRKDGSLFAVEISSVYLETGGGKFVSFCRDITDRKLIEEKLRESEVLYRSIGESIDYGVWICAPDGRNTYASESFLKMVGITQEQCSNFGWGNVLHPDDAERTIAAWQGCVRTEGRWDIEHRFRGLDNQWHYVLARGVPVRNEQGKITCWAGINLDISQLKQAEQQIKASLADKEVMNIHLQREVAERIKAEEALQALNDELERRVERRTLELQHTQKQFLHAEKLSAIGKLSASIAHEFNNPLQGIVAVLYGLKKKTVLDEEDKALLEEAIEEGGRIRDLIRSLQEFNRPSSGKKRLLDVHKTLDSVLLLNKNDFRGKRISVELDYAERLPQIEAVPDQIKQVFLNLLTNAADACMQAGGVITVSTRLEGEEKVAVEIKDTGFGIKPTDMELIFQPFYTTKSEIKGTGLGLSISFGIIKQHRGEINVVSQPGEGSTFTVILPIKGADDLP